MTGKPTDPVREQQQCGDDDDRDDGIRQARREPVVDIDSGPYVGPRPTPSPRPGTNRPHRVGGTLRLGSDGEVGLIHVGPEPAEHRRIEGRRRDRRRACCPASRPPNRPRRRGSARRRRGRRVQFGARRTVGERDWTRCSAPAPELGDQCLGAVVAKRGRWPEVRGSRGQWGLACRAVRQRRSAAW